MIFFALPDPGPFGLLRQVLLVRFNAYCTATAGIFAESYDAAGCGKQSMVASNSDITTGLEPGAPLANDNIPGQHHLSTITLHA
jgi:hypothetical protein